MSSLILSLKRFLGLSNGLYPIGFQLIVAFILSAFFLHVACPYHLILWIFIKFNPWHSSFFSWFIIELYSPIAFLCIKNRTSSLGNDDTDNSRSGIANIWHACQRWHFSKILVAHAYTFFFIIISLSSILFKIKLKKSCALFC